MLINSIPLLEGEADPATKEALRYRAALWEGYQALKTRPLPTNTAVQVIFTPPRGEGLLRERQRPDRGVINLLYLVEQGLLDIPVLYLSRHILRNRLDYYSGLQSITETGAWEPWLLYVINGVTDTARWTTDKIVAVRGLLEDTADRMRRA